MQWKEENVLMWEVKSQKSSTVTEQLEVIINTAQAFMKHNMHSLSCGLK